MNRLWTMSSCVGFALVLVMSLATQVVAGSEDRSASATGKQRILQIATAELPPKVEKTTHRYILASMPGDTVAVMFIDQHLYAMRKDGTLEQVEGSIGGWAIASGGGAAFAVMHNIGRPKDVGAHDFYLPVQVKTFDHELKPVSKMKINRHKRWIVSNDGQLIIGVGPHGESISGSNKSWFYREGMPTRTVAKGAGGWPQSASLSASGDLFVVWGGSKGILAYDGYGNKLWSRWIDLDDHIVRLSILEKSDRIAMSKGKGGQGASLFLLDFDGNVISEPPLEFIGGETHGFSQGRGLVLWSRTFPLRRMDPRNGSELWRIEPEELGYLDGVKATSKGFLGFDWKTPLVKLISLDGEIVDVWSYPGKGKPWGFAGSMNSQERLVMARGSQVYVCELQEE